MDVSAPQQLLILSNKTKHLFCRFMFHCDAFRCQQDWSLNKLLFQEQLLSVMTRHNESVVPSPQTQILINEEPSEEPPLQGLHSDQRFMTETVQMSIKLSWMSSGSFSAFCFRAVSTSWILLFSIILLKQQTAETELRPLPVSADFMSTFFEPSYFVIFCKKKKNKHFLYVFLLDSLDTLS